MFDLLRSLQYSRALGASAILWAGGLFLEVKGIYILIRTAASIGKDSEGNVPISRAVN